MSNSNLPTAAKELQPLAETAGPAYLTLTIIEGTHTGHTFSLAGHDTFLVGRSKQCHFQLEGNDRYFWRIHFMVEVNVPRCRLTDLGSLNGTFVNDQRVEETVELHDGDTIRAGHTVLKVSLQASDTMPVIEALRPESPRTTFPVVPGYTLVREVGRGSMGTVYEARRRVDDVRVALKLIVPAESGNGGLIEGFLGEARRLCQLEHPHIIAFRDMGEVDGRLFFVMDYVEGIDAGRMLQQEGPLPVRQAVRLVCQVLLALAYAHDKGFVHRDIKPSNILIITEEAKKIVRVADFGLAHTYQASKMSGLTMQSEVGKRFSFMPPEQATKFREVKPAADQYGAGATLYHLLTGQFLYDFQSGGLAALTQILTEDPVPIETRRSDLPAGLSAVIGRATCRNPEGRFPDVRAFRQALLPFAQ